jgi:hypothetical protein
VLLALAACSATSTPSVPRSDAARLLSDVKWLADDAREGRRAGTEQGRIAGEWIAERFDELGLEPAGTPSGSNRYLQEFSVPMDARDGGGSHVGTTDQNVWRAPAVVPLFCSERGEASGPLVFCGYGIENAERGWNDYQDKDIQGGIAFIVRGTPPLPTGAAAPAASDTELVSKDNSWGPSGSIFTKIMTAKRRGAVAVILVPSPLDTGEPLLAFDAGQSARAGIPALMVSTTVAAELLPGYEALLGAPAHGNAGTALEASFFAGKARTASVFADVARENGPAFNVLARLPGVDRSRTIVVGAHYDHLGHGGTGSLAPDKIGQIHNGADDNASGTAAVLEMARLMKESSAPPCDVLFALWSGEELGLLGSEYWAVHPTVAFDTVRANLNLDMVGRAGSGKLQVLGAGTSPVFAEWMPSAGESAGLTLVVSTAGGALGGSSDHQSFVKRKIPALHLFSGLHADYHKPTDDVERFDAEAASQVARLGVDLIQRMASAPTLAFVEQKLDKEREGAPRGGFRTWFGSVPSYTFEGPGVLLDGTSAGSPAERAGLFAGDVLLQIGDVKIETVYDLTYVLQLYKAGDVVQVRYRREGSEQQVRLTLATREIE